MIDIRLKPRFSPLEAQLVVAELFDLEVKASELPSERDQNFHLSGSNGDEYVLKIVNPTESSDLVQFESLVLNHLAKNTPQIPTPRIVKTSSGELLPRVADGKGNLYSVRMVTFLPGTPFAKIGKVPVNLYHDLGRLLAELDLALVGLWHPSLDRDFAWSIYQAANVMKEKVQCLRSREEQIIVDHFLSRYEGHLFPKLGLLPDGVIHNDANDNNILVAESEDKGMVISGLLDFGDIIWGPTIHEPAIAASYAMANHKDPIAIAAEILAGYHEISPRREDEIEVYLDMIGTRLATSAVMAAYQRSLMPEHTYLSISEEQTWHTMRRLISLEIGSVTTQFMERCCLTTS